MDELAAEQKFEVTYVENESDDLAAVDDSGDVQALVQLSTMPVAVCYGTGSDKTSANQDAARNALGYLKMMTKNPGTVTGTATASAAAASGATSTTNGTPAAAAAAAAQ